jgi:putative selenate reductase
MQGQSFSVLLRWILQELEHNQSVFGIHRSQFFVPRSNLPYSVPSLFGQYLATPIGPAAGPHTQLAQNIVCAWLCGGRFIELKTVQIMDELEISRPCIDMEDEGYNVEWSQELKLDQSVEEYAKAWALVHLLPRILGWDRHLPLGTIFNMSVGYNLAGIQSPAMTRFMASLIDAGEQVEKIRAILHAEFPAFEDVEIPSLLTNNVTLSTMHGCPPDEVERIARYLMQERHLNTTVKLNPTLLGSKTVRDILHENLGFRAIDIPDPVFEHDMQYSRAVELVRTLRSVATETGLQFGVKLSNTLATANHKGQLPGNEMYMSGRALYPVTLNLFHKLSQEFQGDLNVSFSAGADALNIVEILAAGARPVTAATDLLKPGGYARLRQCLETLEATMQERGISSLDELAKDRLAHLERAAAEALHQPRYKKAYHPHGLPKVQSALMPFDCITAPCKEACPVCQHVPEYAHCIATGDFDCALSTILARNPLPGVTGYICTHLCQSRCTRNNYDEPVAIRALKRVAHDRGQCGLTAPVPSRHRVAVIGGGPSGLAAAYFLALSGIRTTIFEARDRLGGMVALAPAFRLPDKVLQEDIERIRALGVEVELNHRITSAPETLLGEGFEAVYVACGFQRDAELALPGVTATGVIPALHLLEQVARGARPSLGARVLVVGGGNTAMDAARTAHRLTGQPVTVVYRRTSQEMPSTDEEKEELLAEGNALIELASPARVIVQEGHVTGLECVRNQLGEPGADGRREPIAVPGSEFILAADSIIVAIGQRADVSFLKHSAVLTQQNRGIIVNEHTGQTSVQAVYAGGDAARGPATVVWACADGRRAAEAICTQLGLPFAATLPAPALPEPDLSQLKQERARQTPQNRPDVRPASFRADFNLAESALSEAAARREAERCLQCSILCDKCVEVCPNRANLAYSIVPFTATVPQWTCQDGKLVLAGEQTVRIEQDRQIIHLVDLCNECGNCATFCVHNGKPSQDKPRLFLTEAGFHAADGDAYHIQSGQGDSRITRRSGGQEASLSLSNAGRLVYEDDHVRVVLARESLRVTAQELKQSFQGTYCLAPAVEMFTILNGVLTTLPFLPLDTP